MRFDPPPATPREWVTRLWVVGGAALVVVVVLAVVVGRSPTLVGGLFVWASSAAFSVWLLHEHRRRLPRPQRVALFGFCVTALLVLLVAVVV